MDAEVVAISAERIVSARLADDRLVVFAEPDGTTLRVGDLLRFPELAFDVPLRVLHGRQGSVFSVRLAAHDVHDLRKPGAHGTSRA